MDTRDKQASHISIVDAVETLTEIADMDVEHGIGVSQRHDIGVGEEQLSYRTVHWLDSGEGERGVLIIRETFRVILNYLRHFYRDEHSKEPKGETIEGIKTIMVLVGEAAKKLDKYTHLFHLIKAKSVTELKEYKKLQEFYQSKIAPKIDEGKLGRWLLALSKSALARKKQSKLEGKTVQQTKHVFVDLDSVKKDVDYELFYIRKEDGSRFFNPRLLRNMKLVSDFGAYFGVAAQSDPLGSVEGWVDCFYHQAAKNIIQEVRRDADRFYHEAFSHKDNELVNALSNCLMALMMAANDRNEYKYDPLKNCTSYFVDFQDFLRLALHTREYTKLAAYPPKKNNKIGCCLLDLTNALCKSLYLNGDGYKELAQEVDKVYEVVRQQQSVDQKGEKRAWARLSNEYQQLAKIFKGHPNAALHKILESLQNGNCHHYDPLAQKTMQTQLYYLNFDHHKILNLRMGSPIIQEYIHKVAINEEFKAWLRSCSKESDVRNLLIINLQDRTSWKEHYRCAALEELQKNEEFSSILAVATLAKDTDFYHQVDPYDKDNKTEVFLEHFQNHFGDESSGYYFPGNLKNVLSDDFFRGVFSAIHQLFYSGKNMLLRDHRLDFIEIFDTLLILKIIETAMPDAFCLLCKDGVDTSTAANAMLYAFLKVVNDPDGLSAAEWQQLNLLLHTPALLVRERLIMPDKFNRFISALKAIETVKEEYGAKQFIKKFHEAFSPYFKTSVLSSKI